MVLRCLEAYLPRRHKQLGRAGLLGELALLVTRNGSRLTGYSVSNGIHAISRLAGVSIHSLHQFRHTCASDLLEAGVHLAQVQRIRGDVPKSSSDQMSATCRRADAWSHSKSKLVSNSEL